MRYILFEVKSEILSRIQFDMNLAREAKNFDTYGMCIVNDVLSYTVMSGKLFV